MTTKPTLRVSYLGRVGYREASGLQESVREEVLGGGEQALLLLEHPPVFTLGRNANDDDVIAERTWLEARGVEVFETDRGGQVTYHGPGQLVGYPILDLKRSRRDVRRYVRRLQEVLVAAVADYRVEAFGESEADRIGVWVRRSGGPASKIGSIGVHLRRWVTTHGFALNVSTDLEMFSGIVVCGLPQVEMCSLESLGVEPPSLAEVAERVGQHFATVFEMRATETDFAIPLEPLAAPPC